MAPLSSAELLDRAAREHRRLERRASEVSGGDPAAVLELGSSVLLHGLFEEGHLFAVHRWLDPSVRARLAAEHEQLGEALALLEELLEAPAAVEDLPALASALAHRLREHVAGDSRILYRPLERLSSL